MERFRVTVHCEDIVAIVLAENEDDAVDKYLEDEIEDWEEPWSQPGISVKEITD